MIVSDLCINVSFIYHPSGSFLMLVASRIPYILPFCCLSIRIEQLACNDLTIKPMGVLFQLVCLKATVVMYTDRNCRPTLLRFQPQGVKEYTVHSIHTCTLHKHLAGSFRVFQ